MGTRSSSAKASHQTGRAAAAYLPSFRPTMLSQWPAAWIVTNFRQAMRSHPDMPPRRARAMGIGGHGHVLKNSLILFRAHRFLCSAPDCGRRPYGSASAGPLRRHQKRERIAIRSQQAASRSPIFLVARPDVDYGTVCSDDAIPALRCPHWHGFELVAVPSSVLHPGSDRKVGTEKRYQGIVWYSVTKYSTFYHVSPSRIYRLDPAVGPSHWQGFLPTWDASGIMGNEVQITIRSQLHTTGQSSSPEYTNSDGCREPSSGQVCNR